MKNKRREEHSMDVTQEASFSQGIGEEELICLQADHILNEIIPVVFHKLKNKLTPVLGYSQIIQMKLKDEKIVEKVVKIENNAEKLSSLIGKLQNRYKFPLVKKKEGSISEIIKYFDNNFARLRESGIEVEVNISGNENSFPMVKGQILLLLRELISNSVTSIREKPATKGLIRITVKDEKDKVRLNIRDNGKGISREELKMVPEPFFSGFKDRNGIGYLIVEKILDNHNGDYSLDSDSGNFFDVNISFPLNSTEKTKDKENRGLNYLTNLFYDTEEE